LRAPALAALVCLSLALLGAGVAGAAAPTGEFFVKIPAPGHVLFAVVRVDGGRRFSSGAVPRPQLADPAKLPKGVLAVVDVGRVKKQPSVLVARVLLVNLNKRARRKTQSATASPPGGVDASTGTFNIAVGLKWSPVRYSRPIGIAGQDCAGDSKQIACTGSDPQQAANYGWQTTSLDNYIAFFPVTQIGILLSLDLGYGGPQAAQDEMAVPQGIDVSYFQFGTAVGGKFYLHRPTTAQISPALEGDFKFFNAIDTVTQSASTGHPVVPPTTAPTTPSSNPQTPCNNQNAYDPKFKDYTQLHEYCSKAITGITIHASVPLAGAGWFGPIISGSCPKPDPQTVTCTKITQLPKLTAFNIYASHPGGWPTSLSASTTITFSDGTKQTETFYPH
jgi:hypothetical protein